jgi:hypothetical protein
MALQFAPAGANEQRDTFDPAALTKWSGLWQRSGPIIDADGTNAESQRM